MKVFCGHEFMFRNIILDRHGYANYKDFLVSDYWKDFRSKTLKKPGYSNCHFCDSDSNIQLHHTHYKYLLSDREIEAIKPVCRSCHNTIHSIAQENKISINKAEKKHSYNINGYVKKSFSSRQKANRNGQELLESLLSKHRFFLKDLTPEMNDLERLKHTMELTRIYIRWLTNSFS